MMYLPLFIENNNLTVTPPLPKNRKNRKRNQSECLIRERKLSETVNCRRRNFSECSARTDEEKAEHNAKSRLCVKTIAEGFQQLAERIPTQKPRRGDALSKLETLKGAIDYIKELNRTLNEDLCQEEFGKLNYEKEPMSPPESPLSLTQQMNVLQQFNASNQTPINQVTPISQVPAEHQYQYLPMDVQNNVVTSMPDMYNFIPNIEPVDDGMDLTQNISLSTRMNDEVDQEVDVLEMSPETDKVICMDALQNGFETNSPNIEKRKRKSPVTKQFPVQKRKKESFQPISVNKEVETTSNTLKPPTHGYPQSVLQKSKQPAKEEQFLTTIKRDFPKLSHSISNIIKAQESRKNAIPENRQIKEINADYSAFQSFKNTKQQQNVPPQREISMMQPPVQIHYAQQPNKKSELQQSIHIAIPENRQTKEMNVDPSALRSFKQQENIPSVSPQREIPMLKNPVHIPIHYMQQPVTQTPKPELQQTMYFVNQPTYGVESQSLYSNQPPLIYFPQIYDWRQDYIEQWRKSIFDEMSRSREMCA